MGESIIQFLDTWSPLDVVLIAQNFDRFLLGAWVTLQLTVFALVIGGALAVPLAIARTSKNPFINGACLDVYLYLPWNPTAGADLPDLLRPGPVRSGA